MHYRALVALTILTLCVCAVAILLPPADREEARPPAFEAKGWAETRCDRCRKNLTADPQDGTYIIGGHPYWLHKGCVAPVVKAARR